MTKLDSKVSRVGFGTAQIGSKDWGWETSYSKQDVLEAFERGLELGGNLIDTAETYGSGVSETVVGEFIKDRRDQLFISSKVAGGHHHYDDLLKACEGSLRRLGVKTIDFYFLHWPNYYVPLKETMRAIDKLFSDGKIRYVGVSNYPVALIKEAQSALSKAEIVVDEVRYNLLQREIESEILPYCRSEGIAIMAYSPLAMGMLSGKYDVAGGHTDERESMSASPFMAENAKRIQPVLLILRRLSEKYGKTVSQVALNWLLKDADVYPIVGIKRPSYVEDCLGATGWQMDSLDLKALSEASRGITLSYYPLDF